MKKIFEAILPLFPIAAVNLWALQNRDRFPDPMATHWDISGRPDGFASLQTHLLIMNLILGLIAAFWIMASLVVAPKAVKRLMQLIIGLVFTLISAIMLHVMIGQLDLVDATQAEFGFGLLLWLLPVLLLIPVFVSRPEVSVGESVKISLRHIPFLRLGLEEIKAARVGSVRARDFGGWGLRYSKNTTAFVSSSGEALELELEGGARVLVRTDRASELAREIEHKRRTQ